MNIILATTGYLVIVIGCISATRLPKTQARGYSPTIPVILAVATIAFFAVLDTTNLCNPGWCGRYGFPFEYREWSDGIIDSKDFGIEPVAGRVAIAVALDSLLAVSASVAVFLGARNLMKRSAGV